MRKQLRRFNSMCLTITVVIILLFVSSAIYSQTEYKLLPVDGNSGDNFGSAVSIDGNRAVMGAYKEDDNGGDAGAAYVFLFNQSTNSWEQETKLLASDGQSGDMFGYSVSISGDYIAVSAKGSAYIFKLTGSGWVEEAILVGNDTQTSDFFGRSVAIDGDYTVVGAYIDGDNGSWSGSAYIFKRNGSTWSQQAKLLASDGGAYHEFGFSVSISGDRVLVGADGANNIGAAYIFKQEGSVWSQEAILLPDYAATGDQVGISVSIDGNYAIVGAPGDDDMGNRSGSACIFKYNGSSWLQVDKLLPDITKSDFEFGISVAIEGGQAIVGAYDASRQTSGAAYIFDQNGSIWEQKQKLLPNDAANGDCYGISVAVNGNQFIAGSFEDDDNGGQSGSAYLYKFNEAPIADAGEEITVEGESISGTSVMLNGGASFDPNGDPITYIWEATGITFDDPTSQTPSAVFPLGATIVKLVVNDGVFNSDADYVTINVIDTTPPNLFVTVSPTSIWPPNHQMKDIIATIIVSDICDPTPVISLVSIESNEPDDAPGGSDGNTVNDIQNADMGTDDREFQLRAERNSHGSGRIYTITYSATDASGNYDIATATVTVPHNRGKDLKKNLAMENNGATPVIYSLNQNYPNPFNPETELSYQIPEASNVNLVIYNSLGQKIRTLVSEFQVPGSYKTQWDGTDSHGQLVSSGIYFYLIKAGEFTQTRKMMFVR